MNCLRCGKTATKYNAQGLPVCPAHSTMKLSAPECPKCKLEMKLREGKYGQFWGCLAFPMCDGIRKA